MVAFTFAMPASVFSGSAYAIVATTSSVTGGTDSYAVGTSSAGNTPYSGGSAYTTSDGSTWSVLPYDLTFKTYVQVSNFIQLEAGWNLVSLPVVPDNTKIATVLKPVLSNVTIV
jgi:hypothetical protein